MRRNAEEYDITNQPRSFLMCYLEHGLIATRVYQVTEYVEFFVQQYVKLRMLQFYCDFIDRNPELPLFQYCEMDTDSVYIVLANESVDDLVTLELQEHYIGHRTRWLLLECCTEYESANVRCLLAGHPLTISDPCCIARKSYDKRKPSLFKVEWCCDSFVGLCSKTSNVTTRSTRTISSACRPSGGPVPGRIKGSTSTICPC